MYFKLYPECHLIQGACNGAIYNLLTGDVISIDHYEKELLSKCENNAPIKSLIEMEILKTFEEKNLGTFYESPIYVEKYRFGLLKEVLKFVRESAMLHCAYIELTNACNLDCYFCYDEINSRRILSLGCSKWKIDEKNRLELNDWENLLYQLYNLGCKNIVITGGNPLISDIFKNIIKLARDLNFGISTITNAVNLSKEDANFLKKYSVHLIVQVFSNDAEINDAITRTPGSFNALINNLTIIKNINLKFSMNLLILRNNQDNIENIIKFYQEFSPENIVVNYIYPISNNDPFAPSKLINKLFVNQKNLPRKTSLIDFSVKSGYSHCLFGRLAITCDGKVLPCIGLRDEIIGHIKKETLSELFNKEKFDVYWEMSGDKIEICKDCEYRYACSTCRAVEKSVSGNIHNRKFCTYDPYKGKWLKII